MTQRVTDDRSAHENAEGAQATASAVLGMRESATVGQVGDAISTHASAAARAELGSVCMRDIDHEHVGIEATVVCKGVDGPVIDRIVVRMVVLDGGLPVAIVAEELDGRLNPGGKVDFELRAYPFPPAGPVTVMAEIRGWRCEYAQLDPVAVPSGPGAPTGWCRSVPIGDGCSIEALGIVAEPDADGNAPLTIRAVLNTAAGREVQRIDLHGRLLAENGRELDRNTQECTVEPGSTLAAELGFYTKPSVLAGASVDLGIATWSVVWTQVLEAGLPA